MNHEYDRYSYYIEIGRYLGVAISTADDLRKHLPLIPGINAKDLRKLDNLKTILEHLEHLEQENMMQSANKKYRGLIGLQMEGENKETYALTPYLVLYIQMRGPNGSWIAIKNSRLDFPLVLDDLNREFERLIDKIQNPTYEDEIGY